MIYKSFKGISLSRLGMKNRIKKSVDCVMLIALLLLMAYSLIGEEAHEWIGLIFLTMFVIHQVLNLHWWTHLRTCFYGMVRSIHSVVNFLLLADVLFLGGSGIVMSRYLFRFLQIDRGMETARNIHMFCSYWGFLLTSVHLGLHWNVLFYRVKRIMPMWDKAKFIRISFRMVAGLIAVYGGYAFWKRQIGVYLFLKSSFVFFDYSESILSFLADYASVMILFASAAYYAAQLLGKVQRKK